MHLECLPSKSEASDPIYPKAEEGTGREDGNDEGKSVRQGAGVKSLY